MLESQAELNQKDKQDVENLEIWEYESKKKIIA